MSRLTPSSIRLWDAPDLALLVHQTPGHDEHLSPARQEMLHLAESSSEHAFGMAGPWLFGFRALRLVAAAPWSVCGDVDLTMPGKRIAAAGGHSQVKLVDNCRHTASTRSIFWT